MNRTAVVAVDVQQASGQLQALVLTQTSLECLQVCFPMPYCMASTMLDIPQTLTSDHSIKLQDSTHLRRAAAGMYSIC